MELTKGDALVHWYKDDKDIQFDDNTKLIINGKHQTLVIEKAKLSDTGTYTCEVGQQKSTAKLTIESPAITWLTKLPEITITPFNTDATFSVKLSHANIDVKWYKNAELIKPSEKYEIISSGSTKKLIIKKVTLDDQDEYTCTAANIKSKTNLKVEGTCDQLVNINKLLFLIS